MKYLFLITKRRGIMDVDAERALLIKELQQVENISLLQAVRAVLHLWFTQGR